MTITDFIICNRLALHFSRNAAQLFLTHILKLKRDALILSLRLYYIICVQRPTHCCATNDGPALTSPQLQTPLQELFSRKESLSCRLRQRNTPCTACYCRHRCRIHNYRSQHRTWTRNRRRCCMSEHSIHQDNIRMTPWLR